MNTIPGDYSELELHHLQVLDVLLREHSLTRAAKVMNVTQPALSKTLARLRRYFDDPLFVRVSLRMEPTPKALELKEPIARHPRPACARCAARMCRSIRAGRARTFNFCVVDAGIIKLLPPLVTRLLEEAPHVRLCAMQLEAAASRGLARVRQARLRHGLVSAG